MELKQVILLILLVASLSSLQNHLMGSVICFKYHLMWSYSSEPLRLGLFLSDSQKTRELTWQWLQQCNTKRGPLKYLLIKTIWNRVQVDHKRKRNAIIKGESEPEEVENRRPSKRAWRGGQVIRKRRSKIVRKQKNANFHFESVVETSIRE